MLDVSLASLCVALHCRREENRRFVRHVVKYENGSFLTAGQGSVPVRLPEPVVSGLLM